MKQDDGQRQDYRLMMFIRRGQTSKLGKDIYKPHQIGKKRYKRQKPGPLSHNQNRYA